MVSLSRISLNARSGAQHDVHEFTGVAGEPNSSILESMSDLFSGVVAKSYMLQGDRVVVFIEYDGGIEVGEELLTGDGRSFVVTKVAWGSAFDDDSPPLTLVLSGDAGIEEGETLAWQ